MANPHVVSHYLDKARVQTNSRMFLIVDLTDFGHNRHLQAVGPQSHSIFLTGAAGARLQIDSYEIDGKRCSASEVMEVLKSQTSTYFSGLLVEAANHTPALTLLIRQVRDFESRMPIVVVVSDITASDAVKLMRLGANNVLIRPVTGGEIRAALESESLNVEPVGHDTRNRTLWNDPYGIFDTTPVMDRLKHNIRHVSSSNLPVAVIGERGTGKHAVAMMIHQLSSSSTGPFVTIAVNGRDEERMLREVKLAITEAMHRREGPSTGGTLLLDNLEHLSLDGRSELSEYLGNRIINSAGKSVPPMRTVMLFTTNAHHKTAASSMLANLVNELAVMTVIVPSLSERGSDSVRMLARRFHERIRMISGEGPREMASASLARLSATPWPGNIPQLYEVIEVAFVKALNDDVLEPFHVDCALAELGIKSEIPYQSAVNDWLLRSNERKHIEAVLAITNHNRAQAARMLGITRTTLYKKIAEYGLEGSSEVQ